MISVVATGSAYTIASAISVSTVRAVATTTDAFGYEMAVKTSWMNASSSRGLVGPPPSTVAMTIIEKSTTHQVP